MSASRKTLVFRLVSYAAIFVFAAATLIWVVLGSAAFRDFRVGLVQNFLSERAGYPFRIDGDVALSLRPDVGVVVSEAHLPNPQRPGADLVSLETLRVSFRLDFWNAEDPIITALRAQGVWVDIEWTPQDKDAPAPQTEITPLEFEERLTDLFEFLVRLDTKLSDIRGRVNYPDTGFLFEYDLQDFTMDPNPDTAGTTVAGQGSFNEAPFRIDGSFPPTGAFSIAANLGELEVAIDGARDTTKEHIAFSAALQAGASDLQGLFDILRLDETLAGTADLSTTIRRDAGVFELDDVALEVAFEAGETLTLEGNLQRRDGISSADLFTRLSFLTDDVGSEPAAFLQDIRASSISARISGSKDRLTVSELEIVTNAFDEELRNLGPFGFGSVFRTPDGKLHVRGFRGQLGPAQDPFLTVQGDIRDLLGFEQYRFFGDVDVPAGLLFPAVYEVTDLDPGTFSGSFSVQDTTGTPELTELLLEARDFRHLTLALAASADNLRKLEGFKVALEAAIDDTATLSRTLGLRPVGLGPVSVSLNSLRSRTSLATAWKARFGRSELDADLRLWVAAGSPTLRGTVSSGVLHWSDVREVPRALTQFGSVFEGGGRSKGGDGEYQPLVLPTAADTAASAPEDTDDLSDYQPLVLPDAPPAEEDLSDYQPLVLPDAELQKEDLSGYQPLVIETEVGSLSLAVFTDPDVLLRSADIEIGVNIGRLVGLGPLPGIASTVRLIDGRAQAGPLRLAMGQGVTSVTAGIDLARRPDRFWARGNTGNWALSDILQIAGVDMPASGTLGGTFDVSGAHRSLQAFVRSMQGNATVEMSNGSIGTSLLELAGLGVFPWLFSEELRQRRTNIVCLRAPLRLDRGTVSTGETVIETRRVQLVSAGSIDLANDRISLRAEPRPVGRPLARSAWPFTVSGKLSDPQFDLVVGGVRQVRAPMSMPEARVPCIPDARQIVEDRPVPQ